VPTTWEPAAGHRCFKWLLHLRRLLARFFLISSVLSHVCISECIVFLIWLLDPFVFQKIPIKMCPRRPGDATAIYASTHKAENELGWK
jgi:hypothetical protein